MGELKEVIYMRKIPHIMTIVIIVVLVLLIYFCFHPLVYQTNYFSKLGIGKSHLYDSIIQKKGEPLSLRQDDGGNWIVSYDGLDIKYGTQLQTGVFECVTITGNQYRFGFWKIGVGTSRKKIENVYKHISKIKDLPKDEFGIIEGNTWVWFKFDKNDNVSQIDITTGI